MRFLLDTCVIAALRRPLEHASLAKWISSVDESDLYLSALSLGELELAAAALPAGKKNDAVRDWLRHDLPGRFGKRVLAVDAAAAAAWAELAAARAKKGKPAPLFAALIAASAVSAGCTLVTSNPKDFADYGIPLLNP